MLRTAIVGCGKIADEHAQHVSRTGCSELVALCDRELLMAKQMHERFNRVPYFDDLEEMLRRIRPDVVHITTPPQHHAELAHRCLNAGCHVYVEKPFALDSRETQTVIRDAEDRGLKMTVGHNLMFTGPAVRMRSLVAEGFLGGPAVHAESYYCYNLADPAYARTFLGDRNHWVRSLPGGLLQNIISHGIGRLAEHLPTPEITVIAHGFTSVGLQRLGEAELVDELRVIIRSDGTTAFFTFSSQMRPQLSQLRLLGPSNGLLIDDNHHALIRLRGQRYKSYLEHFMAPASLGAQYTRNAASNIRQFISGRLHAGAGMKTLIQSFYRSIISGAPLPIAYRDILLTAGIMDAIFDQLAAERARSVRQTVAL